ncbi:MAG TPA: hypothetical protein VG796_05650 [Verrucomicrobiales bacterium]|nr:hypothetical protein [Verrucomicrobiales bacterium]
MKTMSGSLSAAFCAILTFAASLCSRAESKSPALSASDWTGISQAHHSWERTFRKTGNTCQTSHPGHQWRAQFDDRGFLASAADGSWQWGLELKSVGFEGSVQHTIEKSPNLKAEGARLTRTWDGNIDEWYINGNGGLEHGFHIKHRPDGAGTTAPLTIYLVVRGGLRPNASTDGQSVAFLNATRGSVLTYSGLKVWDADGRALPARMMAPSADQIGIEIDETNARYPLTVDPVAAPVYIKAHNPSGGDRFGTAVAISGDTVVVGAHLEDGSGAGVNPPDTNTAGETGAAYVFVRTDGVWTFQAYLKASNPTLGDYFGRSVAISGDTIVVGATYEDSSSTGVNSFSNNDAEQAGAAYVFVRNNGTWSQQAYLKASNTQLNDQFGHSVAVSGDTVAVGAPQEDGAATGVNPPSTEGANASGAVYIFVRSGTTWTQQAYVKASNTGADDLFGFSVALSGNTLVAGAYLEDGGGIGVNPVQNEGMGDSGAAYVFVRNGTAWTQQAYLKASNPGPNDWFAWSVAIAGDTIVCGAPAEDGNGVGVNPANNNGAQDSGAAYIFERSGTVWSGPVYLKATNPAFQDQFGFSVGVSSDFVVAGAPNEDGSGQRINPVQNEGALDSGAAYGYVRSNGTWSAKLYLKATNTGASDLFGSAVAVSGDTVVVGAPDEDGGGFGINPPDTAFLAAAGGAYLYAGIGPLLDQDFDGTPDIFERYFGRAWLEPHGSPITASSSAGQILLHWQEVATPGIVATPEWSPDLVTWLANGESRNGIPARTITVTPTSQYLRQAALDTTGLKRAFLRLTLTCP